MEKQIQSRARFSQGQPATTRRAGGNRASRVQPVIGFVSVQSRTDVQHRLLADKATEYLHLLNSRQLRGFDHIISEDATCHDDGMWLLQPAKGRTAIRNVWRDLLRSIPDYKIDILHIATEPASNDAFVMWRASGTARLSLIPQRPTTNKPFEHCGVTRLHFDSSTGLIKDTWTWRGATSDEAAWLLSRSYKPFDIEAFLDTDSTSTSGITSGSSSGRSALNGAGSSAAAGADAVHARALGKGAALAFREAFGAVPGADVMNLSSALSDDYACKEGTGVWRAANLASRDACMDYCLQRQEQLAGSPYWHSEALSPDGKLLFIHYQNVLMNKASRTLTGVSSGILVHAFNEQQKITRSVMFRGPMSFSERAQFYTMDCLGCGNLQAQKMGVDESRLGGM